MQSILVIDDDPAISSLLKCSLFWEGCAIETSQWQAEELPLHTNIP